MSETDDKPKPKVYDALMVDPGKAVQPGPAYEDRMVKFMQYIGVTLGLKPGSGEQFHRKKQGDQWFCVVDPNETINYPLDHSDARQPRYDWTEGPRPGIMLGMLKSDPELPNYKDGLEF